MDDKLFDVFSEETEVPECVLRRVDETLEMIENSAESDRGYQKEEKTGKVINGTDRMVPDIQIRVPYQRYIPL